VAVTNRVQAAKKFGHDTWNLETDWDADTDPAWIEWVLNRRGEDLEERKRGPHEGRYLTLMLKGLKPMSWVRKKDLPKFQPYIKSGQLNKPVPFVNENTDEKNIEYLITLPGEEWRARQFLALIERAKHDNSQNGDLYDVKIGKLLGMSNAEIRYFIGR
jgi:hypothetical protein